MSSVIAKFLASELPKVVKDGLGALQEGLNVGLS